MNGPRPAQDATPQRTTLMVLKIAFVMSGVFLGVIAYALTEMNPVALGEPMDEVVLYAIAGVALVNLAAGFVAPGMLIRDELIVAEMKGAVEASRRESRAEEAADVAWRAGISRYMTRSILGLAIMESAGILGLMVALLGGEPVYAYGMIAAATLAMMVTPVSGLEALVSRVLREV